MVGTIPFFSLIPSPPPDNNTNKQPCLKVSKRINNEINTGKGQWQDQRISHVALKSIWGRKFDLEQLAWEKLQSTSLDKNFKQGIQLFHLHYYKKLLAILISIQSQICLAQCPAVYNLGL